MTVTELITQLQTLPGDALVVMSKDAEGNDYSPLTGWLVGHYEPDSTYSGEFTDIGEDAVCLWPIN